jgi:hypothetical protein
MISRLHQCLALFVVLACAPWAGAASAQTSRVTSKPAFRFSRDAGTALQALWRESVAVREERVACLRASIHNDTVFVSRIEPLDPEGADSMGISAITSVDRCGPPEWSGTVHTHIAEYAEGRPSSRFSAQDRTAMRLWYDRWHADGVFCLVYSDHDAHCEADGVVGGMRTRPRVFR